MNSKKPLAIVIGRNLSSRLGMIRAAGMAGCEVVVIQTNGKSLLPTIDDKSKYVTGRVEVPEPDSKGLIEAIMEYKDNDRNVVLLPTDDYAASTIDANYDKLKPFFFAPHVNHRQGAIISLMDKKKQKELAKVAGMNVSQGWVCYFKNRKYEIPLELKYPCFVKPQDASHGHLKKYLQRCETELELRSLLDTIGKFYNEPILIEEYQNIEKEYAVVGLSVNGKVIIPSVIEMMTGWAGVTATGRIHPISIFPNLEKQLYELMLQTGLTGLFDVDLYESGGKLYFNELNMRFGANGFALTYGGVNLPGMFITYLLEGRSDFLEKEYIVNESSFANEYILRMLYDERKLSYSQYKGSKSGSQILSIFRSDDIKPYQLFNRIDRILPLIRMLKHIKASMQ